MNYKIVKNPKWINIEHTLIDCDVDFDVIGIVPFTADPLDKSNPSSLKIFEECVNGKWGEIKEYVPPSPYIPSAEENKATASSLLQATDWTTVPDVIDPAKANPYLANSDEFIAYRNAVRQYAINPISGNIDWPVLPAEDWQTV